MNIGILWLRWTWRDFRGRWLQVLAIAIIIALGTGTYSGLISTSAWRQASNDASYALLNMYDLRASLTAGSYIDRDEVLNVIGSLDHAAWITGVEPRLILPTLVDASTDTETIIVPGRLIGSDMTAGEPHINGVYVTAGHNLTQNSLDVPTAILEHKFASHYGLPPEGRLRVSGNVELAYVGTGLAPEYFMVFTEEGGMMAEANFAVVFVSLETAQSLGDRVGMVNDILLTLSQEADLDVVRAELETALRARADVGLSYMRPEDDPAYNMLYEDIKQDENFWRWMAYIFLAGAVFGAFNLATRLVEAQRREIGIQMALGLPTYRITIRPLLMALQIAAFGVLFGLVIGLVIGNAFGDLMQAMVPLPVFQMAFQPRVFLEAAALGVVLPFLATLIPVVRALRVEPVDAIKTGHLVAKGGGLVSLLPRPTRSRRILTQMPVRNLLLAPRRTLLTSLGVAAAITMLVLVMGALDSFAVTLEQAQTELLQTNPQRMVVQLNFFYPMNSPVVSNIRQSTAVGASEPALQLGGYLMRDGTTVETLLDMVNFNSPVWRPSVIEGEYPGEGAGLIISASAARDLGVQPGDTITLRHPQRTGLFSYDWTETEVRISGIHPLPLRFQTYMSIEQASMMGLGGLANTVQVVPAEGVTQDEVKRVLFDQFGVASVQPVSALIRVFDEVIGEFASIFGVMQGAAVVLALLIAYNSTSINLDERVREMATMFAFGVRVRTALRVAITENLLMNIPATGVGCAAGYAVLLFMFTGVFTKVIQDIELEVALQPPTFAAAVLVGLLAAVLTPALNMPRLNRMDIPSALRVME